MDEADTQHDLVYSIRHRRGKEERSNGKLALYNLLRVISTWTRPPRKWGSRVSTLAVPMVEKTCEEWRERRGSERQDRLLSVELMTIQREMIEYDWSSSLEERLLHWLVPSWAPARLCRLLESIVSSHALSKALMNFASLPIDVRAGRACTPSTADQGDCSRVEAQWPREESASSLRQAKYKYSEG